MESQTEVSKQLTYSDMLKNVSTKASLGGSNEAPAYVTIRGAVDDWNPTEIWKQLPSEQELTGAEVQVEVVKVTHAGKTVLVKTKVSGQAMKLIKCKTIGEKGLVARLARTKRSKLEVKGAPKDWEAETLERALWHKLESGGVKRPDQKEGKEWLSSCFSFLDRGGLKRRWVIEFHPIAKDILKGEKI
ncbi:unnamed protein product [Nezara viridula]|uniref:Uncharacterized protein n=1 Tax=Nezara viridula TaxID=85310 RepID=A0A9P0MYE5_NEZVI|nr:unnamed protein product [Nezara viridula]